MKWLKRLLLSILIFLTTLAVLGTYGFWKAGQTPEWYRALALSEDQLDILAHQASTEVLQVQNMSAQSHAQESASQRGKKFEAVPPATIRLSDQQVNALFQHLIGPDRERIERYFIDPRIHIQDGQIVLAAQIKEIGRILSVSFTPSLDSQGMLRISIASVHLGQLPVPEFIYMRMVSHFEELVNNNLPIWRREARTGNDACNDAAVNLALASAVLDSLHDRPTPPILFSPISEPVRITQLAIEDSTLEMTVAPMSRIQCREAIEQLRQAPSAKQIKK